HHRYVSGDVDIRCITPDFAYDYRGAYLKDAPTGVRFQVWARGQEPDGLRPYDPRALMLIPIRYFNASQGRRDAFIGAQDRGSFAMEETVWNDQKALRVHFLKPAIPKGEIIWNDRNALPVYKPAPYAGVDIKATYLVVPSRSFNVVEMTGILPDEQRIMK